MQGVDVASIVKEMSRLVGASVEKNVKLEFDLGSRLPYVNADPAQLRQVVMNLIINGSDAMGEKSGVVRTSAYAVQQPPKDLQDAFVGGTLPADACVCVEVKDAGCGMKPEQLTRVFDPFFSTKPRGRGLGLAVVLGIIKAHKGAVVVDSEEGKGTRFRVFLPAADAVAVPS